MQIRYDADADALYVQLQVAPELPVSRTRQYDEGTLVDLDRFGNLIGIEVLQPARAWPLDAILENHAVSKDDQKILRDLRDKFSFARSTTSGLAAAV